MESRHIMVIMIVTIVMIGSVLSAYFGGKYRRRHHRDEAPPRDDGETLRLREEVKLLRERLAVIERITVEKENSLAREIEQLRDR
jgi:hypothetical protein